MATQRSAGEVSGPDGVRVAMALVLAALAGLVLLAQPVRTPLPFVGAYVVTSLVPAVALVVARPRRWALGVAAVVVGVLTVLVVQARFASDDPFQRSHDGGVVATGAAARMVLDGENPYTASFEEALRPDHLVLVEADGDDEEIVNPLRDHYPYLPGAFLVQVPVEAAADVFGVDGDPRLLSVVPVAALVMLLVRAPRPSWARAAALVALGANLAVAIYLSWGANDAPAAALVAIAAWALARRPVLAGVLMAIALSLKVLLVVALLPLAVLAWHEGGRALLARFLAASAAVLAVTVAPFALASPGDLWEDTVVFNLGGTDLAYPTSGIGLGAIHPDVFTDGVILATSALLVGLVAVAGVAWLRRAPTPGRALVLAGAMVVAGLLPARSFQISYLPLPVVLWALVWLDVGNREPSRTARSGG